MPLHITAHQDHLDDGALRWRPLARLGAWLDNQADVADKAAANAGLTVKAPSRWKRTYRHPLVDELRQARAAGCSCVPMCRLDQATGLLDCRNRAE